jgi:serine/threonine protein kinase/Tol biopolymer transport system component
MEAPMKYCPKCQRSYSSTQRFCLDDGEMLALQDPYHLTGRTIIEKYRIETLIGVGGMGAVYKAHHLGLDRCVAFKILLPHLALGNEHLLNLFEREARLTGRLTHENIADVKDAGRTADGLAYIVMEWLEGRTLEEELAASGPLSFECAAGLLRQIAAALDAAHARHIIHRDLKPSNVMLITQPDGRELVKVLDFGIGKVISETAAAPVSAVMGTPHYASPEQFKLGGQIDGRADLYALGVMLYQMLTGAFPFDADSIHELIQLQMTAPPPPLRRLRPDAPLAIEQLVSRLLARDPDQRPHRAGEVADLFEAAVRTAAVAKPVTVTEGSRRPMPERTGSQGQDSAAHFEAAAADSEGKVLPGNPSEVIEKETSRLSARVDHPGHLLTGRQRAMLLTLAASVSVMAVAFALYVLLRPKGAQPSAPFQVKPPDLLTTHGKAINAAVSPDSQYVVYVMGEAGRQSLRLIYLPNRTDKEISSPTPDHYYGATFSHDSHYIFYVRAKKINVGGTLYQIPLHGGMEKRVVNDVWGAASLSSDGQKLAFYRVFLSEKLFALMTASADGSAERQLAVRKDPDYFYLKSSPPVWSRDGKLIASVSANRQRIDSLTPVILRVAAGSEVPASFQSWREIFQMVWHPDGHSLLMGVSPERRNWAQLWQLAYPGGQARQITNDLSNYVNLSLTADASALVTVKVDSYTNLWMAPDGDESRAIKLTHGTNKHDGSEGIDWTADGKIIYTSKSTGKPDLWMMNADGSANHRLRSDNEQYVDHSVTPNDRYVLFASDRTGAINIWRMDPDGSNLKQLTFSGGWDTPRSSDGRWALISQHGGGRSIPHKVPLDGGDPTPLGDQSVYSASLSPDGRWIAGLHYDERSTPPWKLIVIPFEGTAQARFFELPASGDPGMVCWSADGQALHFILTRNSVSNIWSQPLEGKPRQLTHFTSDLISRFAWSRDGRQLAWARTIFNGDVVLLRKS